MKSLLVLSIALIGLECAGEPTSSASVSQRPHPNVSNASQKIDLFSIGRVFDEPKQTEQSPHAIRRTLQDDPKLMRDYQQKWESYLNSSQSTPTPVFNPTRIEMLR